MGRMWKSIPRKWNQHRRLVDENVIQIVYQRKQGNTISYVRPNDKFIFYAQHRPNLFGENGCYLWESPCYFLNWFYPERAMKSCIFPVKKKLIVAKIFVNCITPFDGKSR